MNITVSASLFGWRIGAIGVRVDVDPAAAIGVHPTIDSGIKRFSRWWTERMMSA